ncbi:NAD(P)-binding protein [Acrodontium crateriforme]|uniref:NAD(P)-binding protein n=1 Tax=Acrodontium crateriforme TaxID=150365 RepID=A0AAQ3M2M4_9PEZI|nr:NAD(P)-binding protein [Acrodontium crateriforme]
MSKAILVHGATGKQGGAVVRALLAHQSFSDTQYTIYGVTRDPSSSSSQRLATLSPAIKPISGDLRGSAFANIPADANVSAVFVVTYPGKTEVADATAAIDAAVEAKAQHIVVTSVDRGVGSPATDVPHFITKYKIEEHLRNTIEASDGKLTYTILRPPFFMDNLEPGFIGKVMATLWRDRVNADTPLAMVDTTDIGAYAAAAILEPSSPTYRNAAFEMAGDQLTFKQANEIFKSKMGYDIPTTWSYLAGLLPLLMADIKKMFDFFNNPGFAAKPEESNKIHSMTDFASWLAKSKHVKK